MMKYTDKYWKLLIPLLKRRLGKRYGKEYTKALITKADGVYRGMLNRVDDVGEDNPMASNIYEGLVVMAIWKASDGKISVNDLRKICMDMLSMPILKVVGLFINGNKESGVRKYRSMIEKDAEWLEEHPQYKDVSWDFHIDDTRHKEGFCYYFTRCPLNNFARREGCLEVLPVMCDVDFLIAKLMHFKLHREHTLADGGEVCDYWYVGDREKQENFR